MAECSGQQFADDPIRFFPAYDDDRASLQAAYAPVCSFSFSTDTAPNVRSRAKRLGTTGDKRFPNQHKLDWKQYLTPDGSRNLTRVKYPGERSRGRRRLRSA